VKEAINENREERMSADVNRRSRLLKSLSETPSLLKGISNNRIFVVHRHLGSILHYDLRIEINGILKSWAIPKGPSMNTNDRRLAILTDDQPLSHAAFTGVVPEGAYGAGIHEKWDKGTFIPHAFHNSSCNEHDIMCQLKAGRLKFTLRGKKLRGVFSLVRINDGSPHWLLIKGNDKFAVNHEYNCEHYITASSIINRYLKGRNHTTMI
jgi:bifunctional non-homologous end joining protein LigD